MAGAGGAWSAAGAAYTQPPFGSFRRPLALGRQTLAPLGLFSGQRRGSKANRAKKTSGQTFQASYGLGARASTGSRVRRRDGTGDASGMAGTIGGTLGGWQGEKMSRKLFQANGPSDFKIFQRALLADPCRNF